MSSLIYSENYCIRNKVFLYSEYSVTRKHGTWMMTLEGSPLIYKETYISASSADFIILAYFLKLGYYFYILIYSYVGLCKVVHVSIIVQQMKTRSLSKYWSANIFIYISIISISSSIYRIYREIYMYMRVRYLCS